MGSFKNKIKRLVKHKQQAPRENTKATSGKNQDTEAYRKKSWNIANVF